MKRPRGERRTAFRTAVAACAAVALQTAFQAAAQAPPAPVQPDGRAAAPPLPRPAAGASASSTAADPLRGAVLLGDGSTISGAVTRIDSDGVAVRPEGAAPREVPWSECIGVLLDGSDAGIDLGDAPGVATLADGRRLPGRAEANASGMRWIQPWLGAVTLPSDGVRWISFDGEPPVAPLLDADVVRFRTGDRLEGFVSRLADPLAFEPRGADSATSVPLGNVQSLAFVSTDVDPDASLRRIWLRDGTVLDAAVIDLGGAPGEVVLGGVELTYGRSLPVPPGALAAVAGGRRGAALAHRPMRTVANDQSAALRYEVTPSERLLWPRKRPSRSAVSASGGAAKGKDAALAAAPDLDDGAWPLGMPAIAFDGPAILRIEIDEPALLSAQLLLPPDRRPHGDFDVVIRSSGRELGRHHLDVTNTTVDLALEVEPPVVEFEIVDTGGGAIQDGVVIERGVLIPRPAAARAVPGSSPSE